MLSGVCIAFYFTTKQYNIRTFRFSSNLQFNLINNIKNLLDDQRCQPQAGFIQQQQFGLGQQSPAQGRASLSLVAGAGIAPATFRLCIPLRLSPLQNRFVVWTIPSPFLHCVQKSGICRLVSTPSPKRGLARYCHPIKLGRFHRI